MSWRFVDAHVERTLGRPRLVAQPARRASSEAIALQFWEVGRLTLEHWLTPRLASDRVHRRPGTQVVDADADGDDALHVTLSDGTALDVDHVVFASGYRADVAGVPYLRGVLDQLERDDGFPVLDEAFQTTRGRALHHRLLRHAGLRPVLRVREGRAGRRDADRARPVEAPLACGSQCSMRRPGAPSDRLGDDDLRDVVVLAADAVRADRGPAHGRGAARVAARRLRALPRRPQIDHEEAVGGLGTGVRE